MRVLAQALVAAPGGSVTILRDLLKAWPAGDELLVVCWRPDAAALLGDAGHPVVTVPACSTPTALLRLGAAPPRVLARFAPDVVWSQAVMLRGADLPQAVHWRDIGSFVAIHPGVVRQRAKVTIERRDLRDADLRIFNSAALRDAALARHPIAAARPHAVVPNGLDLAPFLAVGAPAPRAGRPLRILVPQTDAPHKDPDLAASTLARLAADPPAPATGVAVTVAGIGEHIELRRRAALAGADVTVAGYVSRARMAELYAACDLVLISSRGESFCNPAVEAAAAGRPFAAPPLPVLAEVGGPLAVTAATRDPEDLAAAARAAVTAAEDPARVAAARAHAGAYAADRRAAELRGYLAALVAAGRGTGRQARRRAVSRPDPTLG